MNAREYALDVLDRVFTRHGYAALLMRKENELDPRDQAFISEVVYGTIRNYTILEKQWKDFVRKSVKKRTALLLDMTIYQIYKMDKIPEYAAVDAAVELANEHERGFVNAILRKVIAQGWQDVKETGFKSLSVKYSHPEWILNLWKAHYGEENARKIAEADQERGEVTGRINTLKISKERLEQNPGVHFLNDVSFRYDGKIPDMKEFHNGAVLIQDLHSAAVPGWLDSKDGMKVLDACAAPGTKTQQIAMHMHDKGQIIACDLHESRTQLIEKLMKRTGVHIVSARTCDSSVTGAFEDETFDRILVDAPCSGLGDLRHKPEIRWHAAPSALDSLIKTQTAILNAVAPYLKKDGILVYSTCTLNRKENELQVKNFLAEHPDYELIKEKTMFPFENGGDGFYVAQLRKKAA